MTTTPILALDELASGQAIPEMTVNENTRWLEFLGAGGGIVDRDLTAPPGSPADGVAYLVDTGASGAWAGHDGEVALYISTAWAFKPPTVGMDLYVDDEGVKIVYNGATWDEVTTGGSYTNEQAQDAVGGILTDAGLAVVTYNDAAPSIDVNVPAAVASDFRTGTDATKALTSDGVWDAADYVALTDATTVAVDMSAGFNFSLTIGGNRTLGAPSNMKAGQTGLIVITQDGTGSRTLAYNAAWLFAGGTDPTLSTAAGAKDALFYQVLPGATTVVANLVKAIA